MKPISFKGQNVVFAKDQPEYQPLPALRMPDGEVITCWELSDEELEGVTKTKRIYLSQLTFNQALQPVKISVDLSDGIEPLYETLK
jgi:hypothetical protein